MRSAFGFLSCLALLPLAGAAAAPQADPPAELAKILWAVTDTVLDQHVDPPTRPEMLHAAVKRLLKAENAATPPGLSRRLSEARTEADLATLLRDVWPKGPRPESADEPLTEAVVGAALAKVPGGAPNSWVSAFSYKATEQFSNNRYVGTGIQITVHKESGLPQIVHPFPGGPARKAGAKSGDLMVSVNGVSLQGQTLIRAVELLRGDEGTDLTVVVRQPDEKAERTLKMTRAPVPIDTVLGWERTGEETFSYRLAPDLPVAYLRITAFRPSTLHELRRAEAKLKAAGFRALVLDLRGCFDGSAHDAALAADGLLSGGTLWRERDAQGRVRERKADADVLFAGWPVVVLTGQHLAPAGQLFAAALQDNGRATVVGDQPAGDGGIGQLVPLPHNLGGLHLRTGSAERAVAGKGWGVRPDLPVKLPQAKRSDLQRWFRVQEAPDRPADAPKGPPDDPQLSGAIDHLKSRLAKEV